MTPGVSKRGTGAILLLGARSEIGLELLKIICPGRAVVLAARGNHRMKEIKDELCALGAVRVEFLDFDAKDCPRHRQLVEQAFSLVGEITTAIVAFGILGNQELAEIDEAHAWEIAQVDYSAQVSMLTVLAQLMKQGHIVAFTSIAGWRARRANYVYGSTKAGLDAFCQGLSDRLHGGPLALVTARPGFVIGSMSAGIKPAPLAVTPDVVADAVAAAMAADGHRRKPRSRTLWIPGRLCLLAGLMRAVPRPIWRHMPR